MQKIYIDGFPKVGIYLRREVSATAGEVAAGTDDELHSHLGRYTDKRVNVTAWFKMFVYLGTATTTETEIDDDNYKKNKCYILESRPDSFRHNQSWGWRSQKLYNDLFSKEDGNSGHSSSSVRCCVVMGLV